MAHSKDTARGSLSVPGYELVEHIATGGYGSVWRATDSAGDTVAVKILHESLVSSEEAVGRFEYEAAAIGRIDHPGVVALRELGRTESGQPFMVTELVDGHDLGADMRRGPMAPVRVAAIVAKLAAALGQVHAAGFVHRDIKPSNVMVCGDGLDARVVLLDFGIAKLASGDGPGLTASQFTVGTPTSMAPEQIRGESVDARTDVYGLGALVYSLLTGQLPFAASPAMLLPTLHMHGDRPQPTSIVEVPPAFDAIVEKAMAADPAARYPTPSALAEALSAAVGAAGVMETSAAAAASVGVLVAACVDDGQLRDDVVLDDCEAIVDIACETLESLGFQCVRESGDAVVYACELSETMTATRIGAALRVLHHALRQRATAHSSVNFAVLCDLAPARADLIELASRRDETSPGSITASKRITTAFGAAFAS